VIAFAGLSGAWQEGIVDSGKLPELLLLVAFLVSWGFIRLSTHMIRAQVRWWPGNVQVGGTHIHHLVFGIFAMLVLGYVAIAFEPASPWRELCAVGFGIGMGLTLDEFALWLDLRDVYWLPEGRKSIDAVVITAAAGLLLLIGVRAWIDLADGTVDLVKAIVGGSALLGLFLAVICALRGRPAIAALSLVLPLAGLVGVIATRSRPHSIWARVWDREVRERREARHRSRAPGDAPGPKPGRRP
jgi:lysyl-tRNA synthetase class 2